MSDVRTDEDFVRVCTLDELPSVGVAAADIGGRIVAMIRTETGELHAVDDTCTHGNVSLSEGELDVCTLGLAARLAVRLRTASDRPQPRSPSRPPRQDRG